MPKYSQTKSTLSPEFRFLIACCQTDPTEKEIAYIQHFIQKQHSDLTCLAIASSHGILPLVYKAATLHTQQIEDHTLLAELKTAYMSIVQRNMLMSAELIRIINLLHKNDIEALAFKGPALAQMAYGDITLRQFGDLDILIRKKDRTSVLDLLVQEGYVLEIVLQESTKKIFFDRVNVIGLYKPSLGIYIEIHWELLSRNYAIEWKEKALWQKKTYIPINHQGIRVLPTEQLLLYLCSHGAKHLYERLEWICDIDRTVRSAPDLEWEQVYRNAETLGVVRILHLGLSLAQHFFTLELPQSIQNNIHEDPKVQLLVSQIIAVNFSETSPSGKNYSTFALLWNMREKFADRLRFAWYALFATKFDDFKYIQLPDYLSFLYPFVRPFRLITKYFHHKP